LAVARVASILSLGAAAIHFAVIGEHFADDALYGLGFALAAWFQALWAVLYAVRPSRRLALAGIFVNAAIVFGWVLSRTVGLPIGAAAGQPEPAGALDLVATGLEVALIVVLVLSLNAWESWVARRVLPIRAGLSEVAALGLTGVLVTAALALPAEDHHVDAAANEGSGHAAESGHTDPEASEEPGTHGHDEGSPLATDHEPFESASATPLRSPAAPASELPQAGPAAIVFRLGDPYEGDFVPAGDIHVGQVVSWSTPLNSAVEAADLVLTLTEPLPEGGDVLRWGEPAVDALDPNGTLVGSRDLSALVDGEPGTYVLRYLAHERVIAEGRFTIEH
jgi:predicted branched-subunit amino acid permease